MQAYYYTLTLGGVELPCAFRYPDTARYFGGYVREAPPAPDALALLQEDWDFWPQTGKPLDAFAEYSMFASAASTGLLMHGRCVMHAVAFRRRDRAWLIAAEPGVGKSTQIRFLQELHPGEFSVISGDRPVLELRGNGTVIVHPSPWNGKEGWYGADAAPLEGIILLRRGAENGVTETSVMQAAIPLYRCLFSSAETAEILQRAADFASELLRAAPAWTLTTHQVPDSTVLLYQTLFSGEAGDV